MSRKGVNFRRVSLEVPVTRPILQRLVFFFIIALVHAAWFAVLAVCLGEGHQAHALVAGRSCAETHHGHDHGDEHGGDLGCPSDCGRGACVDLAIDLDCLPPSPPDLDGLDVAVLSPALELPASPRVTPLLATILPQAPPFPQDPLLTTVRLLL
jgi:hypothetical protein